MIPNFRVEKPSMSSASCTKALSTFFPALGKSPILFSFLFLIYLITFLPTSALASCGATTLTWTGATSTTWATSTNWTPAGVPSSTPVNAYIISESNVPVVPPSPTPSSTPTIGCLTVDSGTMNASTGGGLTIAGDYYQNLNLGSVTAGDGYTVTMAGTAAQTFQNVDPIPNLVISNGTSVELTQTFTISNALTIKAGAGTILIDQTVTLSNAATPLTIPASATVEIENGGTLDAEGGIVINGVLKIDGGGSLIVGDGETVTVNSGGVLNLTGSSGNVASINGGGGESYAITVNSGGSINLNYFTISRCRSSANGLDISGSIENINNGEFHYLASPGAGLTLESGATAPTTWNNLGFYDDKGQGSINAINASSYTGSVITLTNWSGLETKDDPSNKIVFGTEASPAIILSNANFTNPPATIAQNSGSTVFGAFGFALNQNPSPSPTPSTSPTPPPTNITSITFTLAGNNVASDVSSLQVYQDSGSCTGTPGTQIGSNLTFLGSPPKATLSIPSGTLNLSSNTRVCMEVYMATSSTAQPNDVIGVEIAGTADITNSQGYSFTVAAGPPISLGLSTITGPAIDYWTGNSSAAWNTTGNWSTGAVPTTTTDCQIGNASHVAKLNAASESCQNTALRPVERSIGIVPPMCFISLAPLLLPAAIPLPELAAESSTLMALRIRVSVSPPWPGSVTVNGPGGDVSVNSNWTITGSLTLTTGTFIVTTGNSLTIGGDLTVNGGTFIVEPGCSAHPEQWFCSDCGCQWDPGVDWHRY